MCVAAGCLILLIVQVELLTRELNVAESDKVLHVKQLETELVASRQQLQGYEKIEKELDDIVMQSAQSRCHPLPDPPWLDPRGIHLLIP